MVHQKTTEITPRRGPLGWLARILRGMIPRIAALTAIQLALAVCAVAYSLVFRQMVDSTVGGNAPLFHRSLAIVAAMTVCQLLIRFVGNLLEEESRAKAENTLKARLLDTLLHGSYDRITSTHSAEWMNRLTGDTVTAADGAVQIIPQVSGMLVRMLGAAGVILAMEPLLGWGLAAGSLVFFLVSRCLRPWARQMHNQIRETDGVMRVYVQERLENQSVVRTFHRQEHTLAQAGRRMDRHKQARQKSALVSRGFSLGFGGVIHGAYLLTAAYCGSGILRGTISFGTLTALLQLIGQLQAPLSALGGYLPRWYAMQASAQRLQEPEGEPREPEPYGQERILGFYNTEFTGLRMEGVTFAYPGQEQPVLRNLNLRIPKGEMVALMGSSGLGKSTVLKLLLGLYTPDAGVCMLSDRTPLTGAWRGLFAYVPQGSHLMSGTIRQSLALYEEAAMAKTEELWAALETACADSFVRELALGLDTPLGEDGAGLSEGQLQRLALARAVFSGRPVLLLDEATSALDEETELRVLEHLKGLKNRTVLLVSHRSRAREICDDTILLTEKGSI